MDAKKGQFGMGFVTGWGMQWERKSHILVTLNVISDKYSTANNAGGPDSDTLLEAAVPVFNHRVCNEVFSLAGLDEKLTDTFICAGLREGGVDACKVCSETKYKLHRSGCNQICVVAYFPS